MLRKLVAMGMLIGSLGGFLAAQAPVKASASAPENVIIVLSDDQRWDKVTPEYMPNVANLATQPGSEAFSNAFISNPLCCPSRTTILTGRYSHSTGVWTNDGANGGFGAFDDKHTIAVDFQQQGYRTAMIGKYLNGYEPGQTKYVPPGWSRWFATRTGDFYDYDATTSRGFKHYGWRDNDYSGRVLTDQAVNFVNNGDKPFFLYFSLSAPHGPAIPDPRDVGRFSGESDYHYSLSKQQASHNLTSSSLNSAYSVDRAVGQLLRNVPDNTVVLFLSDNGYMWHENHPGHGELSGKMYPYNASVRSPFVYASLDGQEIPSAAANDLVANVDIRASLLAAAGLTPLTSTEGLNWFSPNYNPRNNLVIEHWEPGSTPSYCGIRTADQMYVRYHNPDGSYSQELFNYTGQGSVADEQTLVDDAAAKADFMAKAQAGGCNPPGYSYTP